MSDSSRAVFLSYAREDSVVAARIAGALRAFGVEGWFDQSERHGGDAWDARVRAQFGVLGFEFGVGAGTR